MTSNEKQETKKVDAYGKGFSGFHQNRRSLNGGICGSAQNPFALDTPEFNQYNCGWQDARREYSE